MLAEANNLLTTATDVGVDLTLENTVALSGNIDAITDVELYQLELDEGQGITLDVDTEESPGNNRFDSFLRVFDERGNELTFNDDGAQNSEEFTLDSYQGFIANRSGQYYVGISSTANQNYNPVDASHPNAFPSRFMGGTYNLTLELVEVVADTDPDSTIAEANPLAIDVDTQTTTLTSVITSDTDVNFYSLELAANTGVSLNLSSLDGDGSFDSYLRVFDSEGNELAFNDDSGDLSSTATDSAIAFLPSAEGEYFIGVSSAGNFAYDPINGNTNLNFSGNRGISTGEYQLEVEVAPVAADNDPDNTISEAIATNLPPNSNNEMLSGEIAGELDVDFYQLELEAGEGVNLDLNTNGLDSELDSYLRLFDADGNELAADDNNDANFTANFSADSSLSFVADTPGSYYVGVGTSGNFNYDPVRGRSNFSTDVVTAFTTTGSYELGIEILEVEPDSDPDNAIAEVSDRNLNGSVSAEIEHPDDVDLYPLELGTGNGVAIELNTVGLDSELDSYLRLFDSLGNELTFDNDDDGQIAPDADSDTDSRLNFAPAAGGEYFIGVSSDGNREYDVVNGSNNFSPSTGFSSGAYELNINSAPIVADTDIDNTLDEAIAIELDSTPLTISDGISTTADLDIYQVNLNRGDTVGFDIDTAVDNRLDTIIKVFDSEGNELGINDDGSAPDENSNLDSYLEFTAFTTGAYYFGVSSFGNFDYDPLAGSNNFSNNAGSTTGFYDLVVTSIDRVNTISGTAMADDLDGTPQSDLISGLAGDDTITGAAEADNLAGGNGNDLLSGNNGDDLLHGGAGADTLVGGNGNDIIDGDRGTDRLVGNGGMDTFILRTNGGRSNITDFTIGTDKIALSSGIGFEDLVLTSAGRNTTISFAERQIGTLVGINPSSITATDFIAASDSL